jgi:hypothetical protein
MKERCSSLRNIALAERIHIAGSHPPLVEKIRPIRDQAAVFYVVALIVDCGELVLRRECNDQMAMLQRSVDYYPAQYGCERRTTNACFPSFIRLCNDGAATQASAATGCCGKSPLAIEPPRLRWRNPSTPAAVTSSRVVNRTPQPRMYEEPVGSIDRRYHHGQEYRIKPSAHWRKR